MNNHILENLQNTNPDCEIWWDSSPLLFQPWADGFVAAAPSEKKSRWEAQLHRLFTPSAAGTMLFRGCTTNPPLSLAAIQSAPEEWATFVREQIEVHTDATVEDIFWITYKEILRRGALLFLPQWKASGGRYGYVSGQVDPRFVADYPIMHKQALELATLAPNVIVKCPGSAEGYQLIEELTAQGIGTNSTTAFTVAQHIACMQAVSRGLERARQSQTNLDRWRSVVTHMSSRFGDLGNLKGQARERGIGLTPADIRWAEVAIFKRAYFWGRERQHPSKMLMCSMRVDTDVVSGLRSSWHAEKIAGGNSVYTCPPHYIAALMNAEDDVRPFAANAIDEEVPRDIIDKLLRIPCFEQSYEFDGLAPAQFSSHASFINTATEFSDAIEDILAFVRAQFTALNKQVR